MRHALRHGVTYARPVDILRRVVVEIRISDATVEVSRPGRSWRLKDANRIVLAFDKRGKRVIHGIGTPKGSGDRTDAGPSIPGVEVLRAFDPAKFDVDVSSSATRYWSYQGVTAGARHSTLAFVFTRPALTVLWPNWDAIPPSARKSYLKSVSRWADVAVNGRGLATWSVWRRLTRQPPQLFE